MEALSPIDRPLRLPLTLEIPDWLRDHRFEGKAVLPAVTAMEALAVSTRARFPDADCTRIRDASFDKFLFLPSAAEAGAIDAFNDLAVCGGHRIKSRLITRLRAGKSAMTRVKTHVTLTFEGTASASGLAATPLAPADLVSENAFSVSPERIYDELVPFGPAFHNIRAPLSLTPEKAVAIVSGGPMACAPTPLALGAVFPLDAAFHAACAWGQRYARVVAFPVGLAERIVFTPTQPGEAYTALVTPLGTDRGALIFDIRLYDGAGALREVALSVRMRDVSAGRMHPPGWVLA